MGNAQPEKKEMYGYSLDGVDWHDVFNTREEAEEAAHNCGETGVVYTCRWEFPVPEELVQSIPSLHIDLVVEAIEEAANDEGWGHEEEPVLHINELELEEYLLMCLKAYMKIAKPKTNCYRPVAVVEHNPDAGRTLRDDL